MTAEEYVKEHYRKYKVIETIDLQDNETLFFDSNIVSITSEHKKYYYNRVLLYDNEQAPLTKSVVKAFKEYIRSFDKPVLINNVGTEFIRYARHIKGNTYVWDI